MRVWHFIAYAYIFSLNMYGHEASMTRCLFSPAPLSTPILFVWGGGEGSDETFCMRCYA